MLKRYLLEGFTFWYEEGKQPKNAVEILPEKEKDISIKKTLPKNKARGVQTK